MILARMAANSFEGVTAMGLYKGLKDRFLLVEI